MAIFTNNNKNNNKKNQRPTTTTTILLSLRFAAVVVVVVEPALGVMVGVVRSFSVSVGPSVQTVQRAQLWGLTVALQAGTPVHVGDGNLNVVREVNRLLREIALSVARLSRDAGQRAHFTRTEVCHGHERGGGARGEAILYVDRPSLPGRSSENSLPQCFTLNSDAHSPLPPVGSSEQGMRSRPMQAWVSCSVGRTTACDPRALGGDQCGEQRSPNLKHSGTETRGVLRNVRVRSLRGTTVVGASSRGTCAHPVVKRPRVRYTGRGWA